MATLACRFILTKVDEREVTWDHALDLFEPSLTFEVQGHNAFEALGVEEVRGCVVMSFLSEQLLSKTLKMLDSLDWRRRVSDHRLALTATSLLVLLHRRGEEVEVSVEDAWGPGKGKGPVAIGKVPVEDWVKAVIAFSRQLLDLFRRLNPEVHALLQAEEVNTQELESWLVARH